MILVWIDSIYPYESTYPFAHLYLFTYPIYIYLPIYLSIYLPSIPIYLRIHPNNPFLCVYLIYLLIHPSAPMYLSCCVCLSIYIYRFLPMHPCIDDKHT